MEIQVGKEVPFTAVDQVLPKKINEWIYFTEKNLPHQTYEYIARGSGKEVVDLAVNLEGAKVGFVVPSYMDIDSIEDLMPAE